MGAIPYCDSGALFAHGLLRNRKETEVSHSPTVSREMAMGASKSGTPAAHNIQARH
jgi:hypothetical protein